MVIEATGNAMAVVRALEPHVARVIVANPMQVKAIAYAQVKTDKIDTSILRPCGQLELPAGSFTADADTERMRRTVARQQPGGSPPHADQE